MMMIKTLLSALALSTLSALPLGVAAGGATNQARAELATVYTKCTGNKQAALTFDDGPYVWLYVFLTFLLPSPKVSFFASTSCALPFIEISIDTRCSHGVEVIALLFSAILFILPAGRL
jgi:hypothetical protein